MAFIYHIVPRQIWEATRLSHTYAPSSLSTEGFIHCSLREQVVPTANQFFRGEQGLVILRIDPARVTSQIRCEPAANMQAEAGAATGLYPHVYGPLDTAAVVEVIDFPVRGDGTFAVPPALAATRAFTLAAIGSVASSIREPKDCGWGDVIACVELLAPYHGGLSGLEAFSHVTVITLLDRARFELGRHLVRRPQGRVDLPAVGIFCQRAKDRPNSLGITTVEVVEVTESCLRVRGLDAIDGTPVLDIKPYYPAYDRIEAPTVPSWVDQLMTTYF